MKNSISNTSRNILYSLVIFTSAFVGCKKSTLTPNPEPVRENSEMLSTNKQGQPPAGSLLYSVSMIDRSFTPASIIIPVNGIVSWTNNDNIPHSVLGANGAFESMPMKMGTSYSFQFTKPGIYRYRCGLHINEEMFGTITVSAPVKTETLNPN